MIELLKKATGGFGPAGEEKIVKDIIRSELKDHCQKLYEDNLGNLIAYIPGRYSEKKVMVAAHADEIGLMVTHIDEEGFLRFTPIGGVDKNIIPHKNFIFSDGITGTVGVENLDDNEKLKFEKMFLDIGADSREDAEELVSVGDSAAYARNFVDAGGRVLANSLDDRAGCAALVAVMQRLDEFYCDTYFVFTAQEEVGCRGAKTVAYDINPDVALAVDVTATGDTPESKTREVSLGAGAAIKVMDRGSITHPEVKNLLIDLAKKNKITYQMEVLEKGATDAHSMQLTRGGVPSGTLSIPCRYIHSPHEMIDTEDIKCCVDLLGKFINTEKLKDI